MREDYLEKLEKMFPKGFIVLYVAPSEQIMMAAKMSNENDLLDPYLAGLIQLQKGGDDALDKKDESNSIGESDL